MVVEQKSTASSQKCSPSLLSDVTSYIIKSFFVIYRFRFELRKFIYSIRVVGTVKARPYINEDLMVLIDPVDFMDLITDPNVLQ